MHATAGDYNWIVIIGRHTSPRGKGQIAPSRSVWWPINKDIATAASRRESGTPHGAQKAHEHATETTWVGACEARVQDEYLPLSISCVFGPIALEFLHRACTR